MPGAGGAPAVHPASRAAALRAAYTDLERLVEVRTRELSTLLKIARDATSTLELEPLLELILDQLKAVIDYTGASVLTLEDGSFRFQAYRGPPLPEATLAVRFRPEGGLGGRIIAERRPLIVTDVRAGGDGGGPVDTIEVETTELEDGAVGPGTTWRLRAAVPYARAFLGVPLMVKKRAIGVLTFFHDQPGHFTERHAELAMAFAAQAAAAIANARLFAAEQRRAEQFRLLSEVSRRITSILSMDAILSQTVRLIHKTFGYDHVHIGVIEGDALVFPATAGVVGDAAECVYCSAASLRLGRDGISGWVAVSGEPYLAPDVSKDPRFIPFLPDQSGSELVLPIKVKGKVIGVLDVDSRRLNAFEPTDVAVLQSLANQVAVAIENARLYARAQRLAAIEERQKLARELHDSVSQALYGMALGARTARTLLDRDPAAGADLKASLATPLDYVLSLAEAALAEMRALIFELRPESLATEGLVAALDKRAASLRARHGLAVETDLGDEPEAPLAVKEAAYRIVQEALHNVVKHAGAGRAEIRLTAEDGLLLVAVVDDGVGFDPGADYPGHLGLRSMRERAAALGGTIAIESGAGAGTRVRVAIPVAHPGDSM